MSLQSLLADEQIASCPILILGNKIDKMTAVCESDIRRSFGLIGQTSGKVRSLYFHLYLLLHICVELNC